jgi:ABC-2 type transport system ATP-binding protein
MIIHHLMTSTTAELSSPIDIQALDVRRGGRVVLRGVDLQVAGGRVTGLLGPSGSGEDHLMRAIVSTQIVAGGTVLVLGHPAGTAALRRRVAYVTQAPSVYSDLTVRENLAYFRAHPGSAA